jgi:hypothetical protein
MFKKSIELRFVLLLTLSFGLLWSCEEDFQDVGIGIVDNNTFSTLKYTADVTASTVAIDRLNASGLDLEQGKLSRYLLGVYSNDNFENLEGNLVSQVFLPANLDTDIFSYGADTIAQSKIDTVLLTIPYSYSLDGNYDNGSRRYSIDSIIGNQDAEFNLNVYRLDYYLNIYNPEMPSELNIYYSDEEYDYSDLLNANPGEPFKFSTTDTTTVVKRRALDGVQYDSDTINLDEPQPKIKIALDKDYFQTNILDKLEDPEFSTQDDFTNYFRGLFLEATGEDGALISIDFNNAFVEMYYSTTLSVESSNVAFDTLKSSLNLSLGGVRANQYKRTGTPNQNSENLYLQGAAGQELRLDLFGADNDGNGTPDQLDELRTKDWILNEASLSFYIDEDLYDVENDTVPYNLYVFRVDEGEDLQITDVFSQEGVSSIAGGLERDTINNAWMYKLRITQYINNLVNQNLDLDISTIGVKILNTTDYPRFAGDTVVSPYGWTGKGVVLHGPNSSEESKKLKFEIFYSELNKD